VSARDSLIFLILHPAGKKKHPKLNITVDFQQSEKTGSKADKQQRLE